MRNRILWLAIAIALGGCTYHVTGPDAANEGNSLTTDVAVADGGAAPLIDGIDVFQQEVESITILCSAHTVALDYRHEATNRLNFAWDEFALRESPAPPTGLNFDELKLLLRCHHDTDLTGYCVTEARLTGEIVYPAGTTASVPFEVVADDRADGSFTCGFAAESVRRSAETVLDALIDQVRSDVTTAGVP